LERKKSKDSLDQKLTKTFTWDNSLTRLVVVCPASSFMSSFKGIRPEELVAWTKNFYVANETTWEFGKLENFGLYLKIEKKNSQTIETSSDGDCLWLTDIYLPPSWQGKGIGTTSVRNVLGVALENKLHAIVGPLMEDETNSHLPDLSLIAKKLGFRGHPPFSMIYRVPRGETNN
jgi:GNAT superfamily N-acetyltransferase